MKTITVDGKLYVKVTPVKNLFHSTMVHDVVNRGDVFVVRLEDMALTVLTGDVIRDAEMKADGWKPAKKLTSSLVQKMKKQLADAQRTLDGIEAK